MRTRCSPGRDDSFTYEFTECNIIIHFQAILEDHCSRIWDTSADRTPTSSSGSAGGGDGTGVVRGSSLRPHVSSTGAAAVGRPSAPSQAVTITDLAEEELEDDCIHPPLLQESNSSPPSVANNTATTATTGTTNSSTHFDFHQQVNESQLIDAGGAIRHEIR